MSHIPNNAMPHAVANDETETETGGRRSAFGFSSSSLNRLTDKVRENPGKTAAAGMVAAGLVAAAAIPAIRGRRNGRSKSSN